MGSSYNIYIYIYIDDQKFYYLLCIINILDLEDIQHAETMMNNPAKSAMHRIFSLHSTSNMACPPTQITYRRILQAQWTQMTQSVSVQETEGTTTTTTTQHHKP
jgi:hypothetical protein